eukprot:7432913-Pyramimonas_sp.AAC.1
MDFPDAIPDLSDGLQGPSLPGAAEPGERARRSSKHWFAPQVRVLPVCGWVPGFACGPAARGRRVRHVAPCREQLRDEPGWRVAG